MLTDKNNVWDRMDPRDGFSVNLVITEALSELSLVFKHKGEIVSTKIIDRATMPTSVDNEKLTKKSIFWEGVAEYLNAGGRAADAVLSLNEVFNDLPEFFLDFDEWQYYSTGINQNGNRVHEFIRGDEAVRWVRNEFIETDISKEELDSDIVVETS